jgi:hypothetical protein
VEAAQPVIEAKQPENEANKNTKSEELSSK